MDAIALVDPISSAAFLKTAAHEMGLKVIGIFTRPIEVFVEHYHVSDEVLFSDCDEVIIAREQEQIIEQLKRSDYVIKAVIAGLDSGVMLADLICHNFKLHCNPQELSTARRDKGEMRKVLKKNSLPVPAFELCFKEKDVRSFAERHPFPLVIKTPHGAATSQVYICEKLEDLLEKFEEIMEKENFFGERVNNAVLETYISGKEYAVNTFSDGEKVYITDIWVYDKIDSESFKNVYYNVISLPLTDPVCKTLIEEGLKVVDAFELIRGPGHLEFKDDPKLGPTLVEINARLAGARMPLFMKQHSNFDPYQKTIEVFLHGKAKVPQHIVMHKHCAVAFCPIFKQGKILEVRGVDLIQKLESYEDHTLNVKPGDRLTSTTEMTTTPLLVFLAHKDRAKLLHDLEMVHSLFSITFH
jgi:biotin carboxylase